MRRALQRLLQAYPAFHPLGLARNKAHPEEHAHKATRGLLSSLFAREDGEASWDLDSLAPLCIDE